MIIEKVKESIIFDEFIKEEITIAKIVDNDFSINEQKVEIKEIIDKKETTKTDIIDVPKVEETIKLAAETKTKSITINGRLI